MRKPPRSRVKLVASRVVVLAICGICVVRFYLVFQAQDDYIKSLSLDPQVPHIFDGSLSNKSPISVTSVRHSTTTASASDSGGINSQLPKDHPHAGARFPNGSWGYIADVTRTRTWMLDVYRNETQIFHRNTKGTVILHPPASYLRISSIETPGICDTPPKQGSEKKAGWRLLANRILVSNETLIPSDDGANNEDRIYQKSPQIPPRIKLLCAIYTHEKKHDHVRAIAETWGWRCDGFFAASTKTVEDATNNGYGAIDLPHEGLERYQNMWRKTRSIWAYIHDNYLEEFDYFYLSGDDTHLIVENLKQTLENLHVNGAGPEQPLYLGHWISDKVTGGYFAGGGPGYVLSRQSVRILVEKVLPVCHVHTPNAAEDRLLGECFRQVGIVANHSVDAQGAQKFHGMHPNFIASFDGKSKPFFKDMYKFWGEKYGYKTGIDLVSPHSISFHLLRNPEMLKRHHAIIYKSCPPGTVLGDFFDENKV